MPECNGWPNRATWLAAKMLSSSKSTYCGQVILDRWRRFRSKPRGSMIARAEVAAKFKRDVLANVETVVTREPLDLAAVDWCAIANHWLKRFADYRSAEREYTR